MASNEQLESFDEVYAKVLNRIVVRGGMKHAHDDKAAEALKSVYDALALEDNEGGVDVSSPQMPFAIESRSEYLLLRAMDLLGNACVTKDQPAIALRCFKMAHFYYTDKFDRKFVKPRELKRKMAKILVDANCYAQVLEELKEDVELDLYDTILDAETTLYIKYAYGRSLVALGLWFEAIPYLSQRQLGQIYYDKKSNIEMLSSTIKIAMELLAKGCLIFTMTIADRLISAFLDRLKLETCPSQIFDFMSSLARQLASKELTDEFHQLYRLAFNVHSRLNNCDSLLFASVVGCSLPSCLVESQMYLDTIVGIHERLLKFVKKDDWFIFSRLKVTTRLIYILEERSKAVTILLNTFNHVSDFLEARNPYYNFFFQTLNDRMWAAD